MIGIPQQGADPAGNCCRNGTRQDHHNPSFVDAEFVKEREHNRGTEYAHTQACRGYHQGTGNARQGSNRSPIMRGGAIIFGPQPREYGFKINKKVRSLALRMALSSRLADNELMVVKGIELPEAKTKHFVKVAGSLGLSKALVVVAPEQGGEGSVLALSARNIPGITLVTPDAVNVYEVLNHKQLVVLEGALPHLEARLK